MKTDLKWLLIVAWIRLSVCRSTAAVAWKKYEMDHTRRKIKTNLIKHKNLRIPQRGSRQTDELSLTDTEWTLECSEHIDTHSPNILSSFRDLVLQSSCKSFRKALKWRCHYHGGIHDKYLKMSQSECTPQLIVWIVSEWIEIESESAREQNWLL